VEQGAFWLYAQCAHGVEPAKLEAALRREIDEVRSELLPAAEMKRALQIIEAGEAHDSETVSDLAEELGEFAVDAHWTLALETVAKLRAVTSSQVRDAAQRLLGRERSVVGWSLPKPPEPSKRARKKAGAKPRHKRKVSR
jgi:predicted Zn-dependent peptidase